MNLMLLLLQQRHRSPRCSLHHAGESGLIEVENLSGRSYHGEFIFLLSQKLGVICAHPSLEESMRAVSLLVSFTMKIGSERKQAESSDKAMNLTSAPERALVHFTLGETFLSNALSGSAPLVQIIYNTNHYHTPPPPSPSHTRLGNAVEMAEEVKIDKHVFNERLLQLVTAWKHDKRSNDALFGGVGSIVVLMGKADESGFQKKNAMHVSSRPPLSLWES